MRTGLRGFGDVDDVDARAALVQGVGVQRQRGQQRALLDREVRRLAVGGEVDERTAVDVLEQLVALRRVVAREKARARRVGDVEEQHAALRIGDRHGRDVGLDVHLAEDHVGAVLQLRGERLEGDLLHPARERMLLDVGVVVAVADRHRLRRLLGARTGRRGRLTRRRDARHGRGGVGLRHAREAAEEPMTDERAGRRRVRLTRMGAGRGDRERAQRRRRQHDEAREQDDAAVHAAATYRVRRRAIALGIRRAPERTSAAACRRGASCRCPGSRRCRR